MKDTVSISVQGFFDNNNLILKEIGIGYFILKEIGIVFEK